MRPMNLLLEPYEPPLPIAARMTPDERRKSLRQVSAEQLYNVIHHGYHAQCDPTLSRSDLVERLIAIEFGEESARDHAVPHRHPCRLPGGAGGGGERDEAPGSPGRPPGTPVGDGADGRGRVERRDTHLPDPVARPRTPLRAGAGTGSAARPALAAQYRAVAAAAAAALAVHPELTASQLVEFMPAEAGLAILPERSRPIRIGMVLRNDERFATPGNGRQSMRYWRLRA